MLPDVNAIKTALRALESAEVETATIGVVVRVPASDAPGALRALKGCDHGFSMLVDLFATDTGEEIEITYHLRSLGRDEEVRVRCTMPYGGELVSAWNVFPATLLPERETAELFGLTLSGHPNPKRLLTVEGVEPLLLKSVAIRTIEEVRDR